jgi:predicted nucleotidyltransferase component of viral defense system
VTAKHVSNLAASVHARLQNQARAANRPFQELLQYYAMERFLYRLSRTDYRERLVLKGALMLYVWEAPLARATKDLDFLGRLDNSLENLERVIKAICSADVEPDGVMFDAASVKAERIKVDAEYHGTRVRFVGLLGKARVAMQLDVGFGDVVTPGPQNIAYPALLDFPAPALRGYPRETVIAEKFEAMVYLRTLNSRMKDFYDVWLLARQFAFDGALLGQAIAATFANRETAIDPAPIAFTPEFTEQTSTVAQWTAFRKKLPNQECPKRLSEIVPFLSAFLLPVSRACLEGKRFDPRWPPGGPWTSGGWA